MRETADAPSPRARTLSSVMANATTPTIPDVTFASAQLRARVDADEELRLRVNIPRLDEATMHERAFAEVGTNGDVREVELVVPKGAEPEGAALKLCLKEVGPGAGLVDCVVQLASHAAVERILRRTPDDAPLPARSRPPSGAPCARCRRTYRTCTTLRWGACASRWCYRRSLSTCCTSPRRTSTWRSTSARTTLPDATRRRRRTAARSPPRC